MSENAQGDVVEFYHLFLLPETSSTLTFQLFRSPFLIKTVSVSVSRVRKEA